MKKTVILSLLLLAGAQAAMAAIITKEIDYKQGPTVLKGYLAYDDAINGKRPGIIVVHEWWGHNEYVRRRARMLAELGYVALAVDMYGDGKHTNHPGEAGKFMEEVENNAALSKARFDAGYQVLKSFELTDPDHIGAIGYCFGGATVLKEAMSGEPLKGVASFHGGLSLPPQLPKPGEIKAKILICHGEEDQMATAEQIEVFKKALDEAKADYMFNVYPGAKHSFTNPDADEYGKDFDLPLAYNAEADTKSWADMKEFFKKIFGK